MKKFFCYVLMALFVLSFSTSVFAADYWDEHEGTEGDPYVIDSNADLIALRDRVNAGTEAADKYYRLGANLTLSSETAWTRIGNNDRPFKGHFNGNNKAIQINILGSGGTQGLFGTISGTEGIYAIKSLTVNGTVKGEYIAGIVIRLNSGNIENCSFSGTLENNNPHGSNYDGYAGGIVGYMTGGIVKNSSFSGSIKPLLNGPQKDGGIVAQMTGGSIENCTASGTIDIPGSNESTYVGGIVGYAQIASFSAIKDCTFSGLVNSGRYSGGIAGYVQGGNLLNNHVTAVSNANSSITGTYLAGGIAGRIGDNVVLESCDVAAGTVVSANNEAAGGIVGLLNDSSTIKDNISHASISGDTANKGGIIGKINAATFTSENNKYSSAEYGIGCDAMGVPNDNPGCIKIGPTIEITTSSLSEANAGEFYSVTLKTNASAGTAVTWSMADATTLPAGLNINTASGVISGTPTRAGEYTFKVQANAGAAPATKELTLKVNIVITTDTLVTGTVNKSYSQYLEATGASVTWALKTGNTLPSGLSLSGSRISGTPREAVSGKTFTIVATGNGVTAEKTFSLTIYAEEDTPIAMSITTSSLPSGVVGTPYSVTMYSNPSGATWGRNSGNLPSGLSLNASNGVISGTPRNSGTSNFVVNASRTGYTTATKSLSITINALQISTSSLPNGTVNSYYSQTLSSNGSNLSWSVVSGRLPNGLTLNANSGLISGNPTAGGSYSFTVRAYNSYASTSKSFSVYISGGSTNNPNTPNTPNTPNNNSGIGSSGGGGGCNSGFGLIGLALSGLICAKGLRKFF